MECEQRGGIVRREESVPPRYRKMKLLLPSVRRTRGDMKKNVNPLKRMWDQSLWEKQEVRGTHL